MLNKTRYYLVLFRECVDERHDYDIGDIMLNKKGKPRSFKDIVSAYSFRNDYYTAAYPAKPVLGRELTNGNGNKNKRQ